MMIYPKLHLDGKIPSLLIPKWAAEGGPVQWPPPYSQVGQDYLIPKTGEKYFISSAINAPFPKVLVQNGEKHSILKCLNEI